MRSSTHLGHSLNVTVQLHSNCQKDHVCHHVFSAKYLTGGRTQILNGCHIGRIDLHPVESDADGAPGSILVTGNWLIWYGNLRNPNDSDDDCDADVESDSE